MKQFLGNQAFNLGIFLATKGYNYQLAGMLYFWTF